MKARRQRRALWGAAAAAVGAGLALDMHALRITPAAWRRIERRVADLRELQGLRASLAEDRSARAFYEEHAAGEPTPVAELLRRVLPEAVAEVRAVAAPAAPAGWVRRRVEATVRNVPLEALGRFLYNAETGRPPWRVVECHIVAGPRPGEAEQASVILETLVRGAETPP